MDVQNNEVVFASEKTKPLHPVQLIANSMIKLMYSATTIADSAARLFWNFTPVSRESQRVNSLRIRLHPSLDHTGEAANGRQLCAYMKHFPERVVRRIEIGGSASVRNFSPNLVQHSFESGTTKYSAVLVACDSRGCRRVKRGPAEIAALCRQFCQSHITVKKLVVAEHASASTCASQRARERGRRIKAGRPASRRRPVARSACSIKRHD
jgi:hypothetical protein